jgi:hypothetical protein
MKKAVTTGNSTASFLLNSIDIMTFMRKSRNLKEAINERKAKIAQSEVISPSEIVTTNSQVENEGIKNQVVSLLNALESFKTNNSQILEYLPVEAQNQLNRFDTLLKNTISLIEVEKGIDEESLETVKYEGKALINELHYMVGGAAVTGGCKALKNNHDWDCENKTAINYIHTKSDDSSSCIKFYIADPNNPKELELLAGDSALQILDKFGVIPALLHLILAVHIYKQPNPLQAIFNIKGTDLIDDLGLSKRTDLTKIEKLKIISEYLNAIKSLVISAEWKSSINKGKKTIPVNIKMPPSIMWDLSFLEVYQPDIFGNNELLDLDIKVRSGIWLSHFFNKDKKDLGEALYNYATMGKSILDLNPFHEQLALRIALIQLTMGYRVNFYTVEQWIRENLPGGANRIYKGRNDYRERYDLKQLWNKTLVSLTRIGFTIRYDLGTYPEDLQPNYTGKNKRGFFERLLVAKVAIIPKTLEKPTDKVIADKPKPTLTRKTYSGKELKTIREGISPKISQVILCMAIAETSEFEFNQYKISRIEKSEEVDPKIAKIYLNAIEFAKNNRTTLLKNL